MRDTITVSALNRYVRSLLESDPVLTDISLRGEISNFVLHRKTGHCYFVLKDAKAGIKAVMFRSDAEGLSFMPEDGMQVVVRGRISLFERDGAFQLYAEWMVPDGQGAIQLAFDRLYQKLQAEGLFAPESKKPLPAYPNRVGLVTSAQGAALADILKVTAKRCPLVHFVLAPVPVQGEGAEREIAAAVRRLDVEADVDLIIVTRGGGSAEDLWAFNAEVVAQAVFSCETPVLSAVGHEVDFTILDYVADARAATPSAAAEMALPDLFQQLTTMAALQRGMSARLRADLARYSDQLQRQLHHPALRAMRRRPAAERERLAAYTVSLRKAAHRSIAVGRERLQAAAALAAGLNPYAVLARGYGLLRKGDAPVSGVRDVAVGDKVELELHDGWLGGVVQERREKQA